VRLPAVISPVLLGGRDVEWCDRIKYLGIHPFVLEKKKVLNLISILLKDHSKQLEIVYLHRMIKSVIWPNWVCKRSTVCQFWHMRLLLYNPSVQASQWNKCKLELLLEGIFDINVQILWLWRMLSVHWGSYMLNSWWIVFTYRVKFYQRLCLETGLIYNVFRRHHL